MFRRSILSAGFHINCPLQFQIITPKNGGVDPRSLRCRLRREGFRLIWLSLFIPPMPPLPVLLHPLPESRRITTR